MRKILRSTLATAAACAAMSAGVLVTTGGPALAAPTCTRTTTVQIYYGLGYRSVTMPSTGTTAASTTCEMGYGAQSSAVSALQRTLNKCYGAGLGTPDGIFGTNTRAALRNAQIEAGLTGSGVDGVYGPVTRDRIAHFYADTYPCLPYNGPGGA